MQFSIFTKIIVLAILTMIDPADLAPSSHGSISSVPFEDVPHTSGETSTALQQAKEKKKADYYEYRHLVAKGVQKALDECREKFKWDRWNCPKKSFLDILDRHSLPSNKELGLTRAMIAAGIVLSLTTSCSYGTNDFCGCSNKNEAASKISSLPSENSNQHRSGPTFTNPSNKMDRVNERNFLRTTTPQDDVYTDRPPTDDQDISLASYSPNQVDEFVWRGCDESVKFGFQVSKIYLETQDIQQDQASKRINAHNYEAGRMAVKQNMKKICHCRGPSGSCQMKDCWIRVPDMSQVTNYLKRLYRSAAKVGAMSAEETDIDNLNNELKNISKDKLVFADASPDYCYENQKLGINGTLNRYCSQPKLTGDATDNSRGQRDSCNKLCTKCGYKIKRELIKVERQCRCRFEFCCEVKCERCIVEEEVHRCVRHS